MNGNVAHGARLIFVGLVVQRQERRQPVALNAQIVDVVAGQQPRIVRAMRHMACRAAFCLHRQMVEDERPAFLCMALQADLVLRRADLRGFRQAAVHVVTVLALHQAFVHPVVEGTVKIGNRVGVAAVAQGRGLRLQQRDLLFRLMGRMARDATHVGLVMHRTLEVRMSGAMARLTACTHLLCGRSLEGEDFRFVAATFHVGGARTMTRFTAMPLLPRALLEIGQVRVPMLSGFNLLVLIFVAGLAGVGPDILGAGGWREGCLRIRVRRLSLRRYCGVQKAGQKKRNEDSGDRSALGQHRIAPNYRPRKVSELSERRSPRVPPLVGQVNAYAKTASAFFAAYERTSDQVNIPILSQNSPRLARMQPPKRT